MDLDRLQEYDCLPNDIHMEEVTCECGCRFKAILQEDKTSDIQCPDCKEEYKVICDYKGFRVLKSKILKEYCIYK